MASIPSLSSLPNDALHHTVSFLRPYDALHLSELNSSFQRNLSLSTLKGPTPLIARHVWSGSRDETTNTPFRSVWIPVLFPNRTHSITLTCKWKDQGHGNRKGALFIVSVPAQDDPNEETLASIDNGTIVYESPLAPHELGSLRMAFSFSPSKSYYLWYRVGGGGGHTLNVTNLIMYTVIHDCADQWISKNYNAMMANEELRPNTTNLFSLRMLRTLAVMGQEENTQQAMEHLATFFDEFNFPSRCSASMKALEEIVNAMIDTNHEGNKDTRRPAQVPRPRAGVAVRVQLRRDPPHAERRNEIALQRWVAAMEAANQQLVDEDNPGRMEGLPALAPLEVLPALAPLEVVNHEPIDHMDERNANDRMDEDANDRMDDEN